METFDPLCRNHLIIIIIIIIILLLFVQKVFFSPIVEVKIQIRIIIFSHLFAVILMRCDSHALDMWLMPFVGRFSLFFSSLLV